MDASGRELLHFARSDSPVAFQTSSVASREKLCRLGKQRRDLAQEWARMFELEQEEWERWVAYYNLGALTVTLATFVLWFSTWNPDESGLSHLDDLNWSVDSPGLELILIGS